MDTFTYSQLAIREENISIFLKSKASIWVWNELPHSDSYLLSYTFKNNVAISSLRILYNTFDNINPSNNSLRISLCLHIHPLLFTSIYSRLCWPTILRHENSLGVWLISQVSVTSVKKCDFLSPRNN